MNILIITQYFWPEDFRINDLARGLSERGHAITVLTGVPNYPEGRYYEGYGPAKKNRQRYEGIDVYRVPLIPRGDGGRIRLAFNYLSYALCASLFVPYFLGKKIDLIFVFEPSPITVGLPAVVLRKLGSIPLMFWVQDLWPDSIVAAGSVRSPALMAMVERLVRLIYRSCDTILIASRAFRDKVRQFGVQAGRIEYFPQSSEELYCSDDTRTADRVARLMPDGFKIMFAGNIGAAQDFATILGAAELLRSQGAIHWVIVGDGRMRKWVESEVRKRGLSGTVHLLGRHPVEAMPQFYAHADVMLVTLKREPLFALTVPAKVQSYMACGKPILAAVDGEVGNILRESASGVSCPAEDPSALAEAAKRMFSMPQEQRDAMGASGKRYYLDNFERTMLLDRLESWMTALQRQGRFQ